MSTAQNSNNSNRIGDWFINRLTNIAPFITLLFLVAVFSAMSTSFFTIDNLGNILRQISSRGTRERVQPVSPLVHSVGKSG